MHLPYVPSPNQNINNKKGTLSHRITFYPFILYAEGTYNYNQYLRIRITLMQIRMLLVTLMRMRIRILLVTLIRIRIPHLNLMRFQIRMRILASK
jgi:hypothetical protein